MVPLVAYTICPWMGGPNKVSSFNPSYIFAIFLADEFMFMKSMHARNMVQRCFSFACENSELGGGQVKVKDRGLPLEKKCSFCESPEIPQIDPPPGKPVPSDSCRLS